MIITSQIHKNEVHIGINNNFLGSLFIHPWRVFFVSYIFVSLIIFFISNIDKVINFSLIGLPVCMVSIFIATIYHKNSCYKLVFNIVSKKVFLYRMFTINRAEEDVSKVRIEIGREIILIASKTKYKIFTETLHDVVSYLPPDTTIMYKGFFGKHFEKELKVLNKPLTLGKYY